MIETRQNWSALFVGRKYMGKTHLAREVATQYDRVIVNDVMRQWDAGHGFPAVEIGKSQDLLEFVKRNRTGKFRISYRPGSIEDQSIALKIMYATVGVERDGEMHNTLIVLEEVSGYADDPTVANIAAFGRHRGIDSIFITQRPKRIPVVIRSNVDTVVSFRIQEPSDRDYLAEFFGDSEANNLTALAQRKALAWGEHGPIPKRLHRNIRWIGEAAPTEPPTPPPPEPAELPEPAQPPTPPPSEPEPAA